jgi:hypothetical protein
MSLQKLKAIGMFQNTFMFHVSIPVIPMLGINNLQFTIRSTTIPGYNRNKNLIRYLNRQYTLPGGREAEGEVSFTSLIAESFDDYNKIAKWFYNVDTYSVGTGVLDIKADAYVKLLGLNETVVTHRFQLKGLYPLNIPEIGDLNQENTDGFINNDWTLAYDEIDYDETNKLTF